MGGVICQHFVKQIKSVFIKSVHVSDVGFKVLGRVNSPLDLGEGWELVDSRPYVFIRGSHNSKDFPDLVLLRISIE